MKEWTREEVERLVPEALIRRTEHGLVRASTLELAHALLQTRLDLEIVRGEWHQDIATLESQKWEISRLRGALERIANESHSNFRVYKRIAAEALKATK